MVWRHVGVSAGEDWAPFCRWSFLINLGTTEQLVLLALEGITHLDLSSSGNHSEGERSQHLIRSGVCYNDLNIWFILNSWPTCDGGGGKTFNEFKMLNSADWGEIHIIKHWARKVLESCSSKWHTSFEINGSRLLLHLSINMQIVEPV